MWHQKTLGIVGIVIFSMLFLGVDGCDKALDEVDVEVKELSSASSQEKSNTENYDEIDAELQKLIDEGKVTLQKTDDGNFILTEEDGTTVIMEGQKGPAEVKDESVLGGGPAVENAPALNTQEEEID